VPCSTIATPASAVDLVTTLRLLAFALARGVWSRLDFSRLVRSLAAVRLDVRDLGGPFFAETAPAARWQAFYANRIVGRFG
jgi:hypothetical protein